jgi:hypothetical protein
LTLTLEELKMSLKTRMEILSVIEVTMVIHIPFPGAFTSCYITYTILGVEPSRIVPGKISTSSSPRMVMLDKTREDPHWAISSTTSIVKIIIQDTSIVWCARLEKASLSGAT